MLTFFHLLEKREHLHENSLNKMDINENDGLKNKNHRNTLRHLIRMQKQYTF